MDDKQLQLNKTYYSVVSNAIIRGKQKMTLREMQLLQLVISQVVKDDKEFMQYTTTATKLAHFLGIQTRSLYRDLDQITDLLQSRYIKIKVNGEYEKFNWLYVCRYNPKTKVITLQLHDKLKPYLTELERLYSQIQIETILSFRSYYAVRLYQLFVCNWGETQQSEYTFTMDEIRDFFQTGDKYKQNRDLIKKTIKPALDELNASDYCIISNYSEQHAKGKGAPIQSISFGVIICKDKADKEERLKADKILQSVRGLIA